MDDIYNMIEEFNKQGWSTKEISTLTGYPEEDINKLQEIETDPNISQKEYEDYEDDCELLFIEVR